MATRGSCSLSNIPLLPGRRPVVRALRIRRSEVRTKTVPRSVTIVYTIEIGRFLDAHDYQQLCGRGMEAGRESFARLNGCPDATEPRRGNQRTPTRRVGD